MPSAIVGNPDETAVMLLALANDAGDEIARRPQSGWQGMMREFTFTTVAKTAQPGTIANVGGVAVISGLADTSLITPYTWIASGTGILNNSIVTAVTSSTVTLSLPVGVMATGGLAFGVGAFGLGAFGGSASGSFSFGQSDYLLPSDFEQCVDNTFWDRTRYWQMRGPMSPQQWQLYKSSVIGRASIQRRYRFRTIRNGAGTPLGKYISIDPLPLDNGAQLVFEYASNAWCESVTGTPQSQWLADTDVGVIDEYLIRLSLKWRLLRRLGLSYSEELNEFEGQIERGLATDGGSPILDMTPSCGLSLIGPWNVPDTGFGSPYNGGY